MIVKKIYKAQQFLRRAIAAQWATIITKLIFNVNGITFGRNFKCNQLPKIEISLSGTFKIGNNLLLNSGFYNPIGRPQKCLFNVGKKAILSIGNNVGISSTAIVCHRSIIIEDNVFIGGNCVIYDTDFHDLDYKFRTMVPENIEFVKKKQVIIKRNAFIGAHSIILKGVTIGEGAIIGAGSVVTKNIPAFEIWGGNPVKYLAAVVSQTVA